MTSIMTSHGIDFNAKPSNLANSAVLRMLEEEEQRQRNGQAASTKRIAWPPPAEEGEGPEGENESPAQRQFEEPPPSTVTLRPTAPVHQIPAPVVASQPAANSFRGGVNMRGDQKWPPASNKEAMQAENEARISLAKGPACRPRKVKKDYSSFFAKNALPNNYPGYKVPPGTQHYDDASGTSQF